MTVEIGDVFQKDGAFCVVVATNKTHAAICRINGIKQHRSNYPLDWKATLNAGLPDDAFVTCVPFLCLKSNVGDFVGHIEEGVMQYVTSICLREVTEDREYLTKAKMH